MGQVAHYWRLKTGGASSFAWRHGLLRAGNRRVPDFLCIGQQKAGTTWLYECLRQHPRAWFPGKKEVQYFSQPAPPRVGWYLAHFRDAPRDTLAGDMTPNHAGCDIHRVALAHAVCPDAKLLLIIRDPVQRAWSHAYQRFVKGAGRRFEDVSEGELLRHYLGNHCVNFGLATRTLANWLHFFPPSQLHVDFHAALSRDPRAFVERHLRFLGLDPEEADWDAMPLGKRIHQSELPPLPPRHRALLEAQYATEKAMLRAWFGEDCLG